MMGSCVSVCVVPMECVHRDVAETEWRVQVAFPVEKEFPLEYKYVLKHSVSYEVLSWEAIPGNRTMTIARGVNVARYVYINESRMFTNCSTI